MAPDSLITVSAKLLQEAVKVAVPLGFRRTWRKKSWPVSLVFDRDKSLFTIIESQDELAGYDLPITGTWPERVQVDGRAFRRVIETCPANEML